MQCVIMRVERLHSGKPSATVDEGVLLYQSTVCFEELI